MASVQRLFTREEMDYLLSGWVVANNWLKEQEEKTNILNVHATQDQRSNGVTVYEGQRPLASFSCTQANIYLLLGIYIDQDPLWMQNRLFHNYLTMIGHGDAIEIPTTKMRAPSNRRYRDSSF